MYKLANAIEPTNRASKKVVFSYRNLMSVGYFATRRSQMSEGNITINNCNGASHCTILIIDHYDHEY